MTYWANSETFVGSAGILPGATGMLPVAFFARRGPLFRNWLSGLIQGVWQNAGHSGQHARAPHHHPRFTM